MKELKKYVFKEAKRNSFKEVDEEGAPEIGGTIPEEDENTNLEFARKKLVLNARKSGVSTTKAEALVDEVLNLYNVLVGLKFDIPTQNKFKRAIKLFYDKVM